MTITAADVWRDYTTTQVPASGAHQPEKRDIRSWGAYIESLLVGAQVGGGVVFLRLSDANSHLAYPANQIAWIVQDPTMANNGVYQKSGSSGSGAWTRVADLPYSFYRAANEGAGTANAIVATNGYPMANKDALIVLNITDTNTSGTVTLSLNGGAPLTIKTAAGNPPAIGGFAPGMMVAGYIEGNDFRLLSDQSSSAIQAAAEAAQLAAEAARDIATGAMSVFTATVFASKALAESYAPAGAPDYIRLEGYVSAGDGGGELYAKAASEPSHAGKFSITLSDGITVVWYEIAPVQSYVNVRAFGAKGGANIDTAAIQAAFDYGMANKIAIFVPGVYQVDLSQTMQMEGGLTYCAIKITSALTLLGFQGLSWIKLADNCSTDAAPLYHNIIGINTLVDNLHTDGVSFDCNGQNNKISPERDSGTYNQFNCAAVMVSGRNSVTGSGSDARLTNSSFKNGSVINSPGVTCIATGQQEGSGTDSYNVRIENFRFYNNGLDSTDHSSVYMWGDHIYVNNCSFDHPSPTDGIRGPVVAAELHGNDNFFTNNSVNNYVQGLWLTGNYNGPAVGQTVFGNSFKVTWIGVGIYSISPLDLGVDDILVDSNRIEILPTSLSSNPTLSFPKCAIYLNVDAGNVARVKVTGNKCYCSDTTSNLGALIGANAGASIADVLLATNSFSGFSVGIGVGYGASGSAFEVTLASNKINNLTPSTAVAATRGISVIGANGRVSISGNDISGGTIDTGIFLSESGGAATLDSLHMEGNTIDGATTADIFDGVVVSGRRTGRQARTFNALPAQSTWKKGDEVFLDGAAGGTLAVGSIGASNYEYGVSGYRRLTDGTANVLNTDWAQQRYLTGN